MKLLVSLLTFSIALGMLPLEAQNCRNRQNAAMQRALAEKRKKDQEKKAARDRVNKAVDEFLNEFDNNGDGSVTEQEYVTVSSNAKEAAATFKEFNKNRDRYLSKTEVKDLLGL